MSMWTQDLLRRAQEILKQGHLVRLYVGGEPIVVRTIAQVTMGIVEGETEHGRRYAISEESLVAVAEAD